MTACGALPLYGQAPGAESVPPATTASQPAPALAASTAEVVRLSEAGTSEDVILAYIKDVQTPFALTADQILYLRDIGVSPAVTTAMLTRDNDLRAQGQTYNYNQTLYPPATQSAAAPAPAPEPAPAPAPEPAPTAAPVVTAPLTPPTEVATAPPPDVSYFYQDLSPYGTWVDLEGVGWCWQPRVVVINREWRPYCDAGHWVWTDDGWFWASDYSWGWAPFHYGRWQLHPRCGWVWQPDRVWGPSWVVWRSEGDYCGWAPLPPHSEFVAGFGWRFNGVSVAVNFDFGLHSDHYTFIAMHDFNERDYRRRCLPATEVTRVYNHTTVINNYVINNNTVVNNGIRVERVAAATHTPIRPVAVREAPAVLGGGRRIAVADRSSQVVYRTPLHAPAPTTHIVAQKVDARHPVIQHGPVALPRNEQRPTLANNWQGNRASATPWVAGNTRPVPTSVPPKQQNYERGGQYSARGTAPPNYNQPYPRVLPDAAMPPTPGATPRTPGYGFPAQVPKYGDTERLYPLRSGAQTQPSAQANQQYYPKSYHQAAEVQRLPPLNSVPNYQSGQQGKTPPGQSRKND